MAKEKSYDQDQQELEYRAFPFLLRKGANGFADYYDEQTKVCTIPITDMDRANFPSLGDTACMKIDFHDVTFAGKRPGPPPELLSEKGKRDTT